MSQRKIDMTTGAILKNVVLFALPIILGNVLQQLYTTVDTLVAGVYCGSTSLAAIGTSAQPVEVLLCIFLGVGTGVSILTSQYVGAHDMSQVKATCETSISFIFLTGIPLSLFGYLLSPTLLSFMKVPADTWEEALLYTRIVFLGTIASIGYNMNAGILRGMGDSRSSLLFLMFSCSMNVVLDLLLVVVFRLAIKGIALATTASQFLSWLVSIVYLKRHYPELSFTLFPRRINKKVLRAILSLGLPLGLNNSLFSLGHLAMQTMVNTQGSLFMAGRTVSNRITSLTNVAINAFSAAASTYSGQNHGAKAYERLYKGHRVIPFVSGAFCLLAGLLFLPIRMPILRLFSSDPTVLLYASRYVVYSLLSQWMYAVFTTISHYVNGTGRIRFTTIINLLMLWAVRIPTGYLIVNYFDGTYVMLCLPISFFFGMVMMLGYYLFCQPWKALMAMGKCNQRYSA